MGLPPVGMRSVEKNPVQAKLGRGTLGSKVDTILRATRPLSLPTSRKVPEKWGTRHPGSQEQFISSLRKIGLATV
jgi:hypothetical protein